MMGIPASRIHFLDRSGYALVFIAVIKLSLFLYFSIQFRNQWPADMQEHFPFIEGKDTGSYFGPMEDFVSGEGYTSMCRMPGLLPVYGLLRLVADVHIARIGFVLLQLITGIFAVLALARIAQRLFGQTAYYISLFGMSISSFVSIWDHFGYSDSFSVYFLIFAGFYGLRAKKRIGLDLRNILLSSVFLTWSIFIRPAHLVTVPMLVLLFLSVKYPVRVQLRNLLVFGALPAVLFSWWTIRNYQISGRFIPLQDDISICYGNAYPVHYTKLRDLMLATGGDYQRTTLGGEMHWYQSAEGEEHLPPFTERHLARGYTTDSLIALRPIYRCAEDRGLSAEAREDCAQELISRSERYLSAYKEDKPLQYYLINRIRLIRLFVFPGRLDNLPFPAREEMNLIQFGMKSFYLLLFHLVNLLGIAGIVMAFSMRSGSKALIAGIPALFILVLAGVLGFVEQRYFGPAYPFMLLFAAGLIQQMKNKWPWKTREIAAKT